MTPNTEEQEFESIVDGVIIRARRELYERNTFWNSSSKPIHVREVIGALLARQTTLFCELAISPASWNGHIAPITLRAMADVHINTAWLLRDSVDRCKKFILFGLGQAKLQLEHRRAELADRTAREGEREYIEAIERWIDGQRATFLTNVALGSWSGISTRQMADEADCIDFYNYVYSSFSACVHSMWQHIAIYNLEECRNPLHGGHSEPTIREAPIDVHYLYLGAKYLRKTFRLFDTTMATEGETESPFDFLCSALSTSARESTTPKSEPLPEKG